ncbi:hypothetical protein BRADI_3g11011v3 [Brachypodium distachyon]|uniref:Uncharacterized protein n=1 Tax=Brachypodium distachyon TaxID=15368 RepID=A0A0Q3LPS0_BRADI|nr:hypothetical protein BRADI_3g11011v3 [Brachypodium distachyon]
MSFWPNYFRITELVKCYNHIVRMQRNMIAPKTLNLLQTPRSATSSGSSVNQSRNVGTMVSTTMIFCNWFSHVLCLSFLMTMLLLMYATCVRKLCNCKFQLSLYRPAFVLVGIVKLT